jgi:hypothetical protein
MKLITEQYFLNNIKSNKLIKKYIPGISIKILKNVINWESICYFELDNGKMFFLDYNLDAIFFQSDYDISEIEIKIAQECLDLSDWNLVYISNKLSHNINNLRKSLDWDCHYYQSKDSELFDKLCKLKNGSWKLENNRINDTIIFSIKTKTYFNELDLYIGIDELSIYPYIEEKIRNKIHFIKYLIEWMI